MSADPRVRRARARSDFASAGALLHEFNTAYGLPSPDASFLGHRIAALAGDDVTAMLARDRGTDVGLAIVRIRPNLYSDANEAYLAELYVGEGHRRTGLGTELLEASIAYARERGCDRIELATDEGDHDAHRLYRRHGFSNLTDPAAAPDARERMYFYEREL